MIGLFAVLPVLFAPHIFQTLWQPYMVPATLSKTDESFVLQTILGPHQTKCVDNAGSVPRITGVVNGSFTESDQKERLYTVHFVDCMPIHANNYGKTRVYITRRGKLVFDADLEGTVVKTIDVNYDGVDEWVSETGFCNQGNCIQSVIISGICGSQIIEHERFDSAYESHCSALDNEKIVKYTILMASPGEFNYTMIPMQQTKKCDNRD